MRILPDVFTNYLQPNATIHSYNTRQAINNKYYHPGANEKKEMSIKLRGYEVMEQPANFISQAKIKIR